MYHGQANHGFRRSDRILSVFAQLGWHLPSQANVRSTVQRIGSITQPLPPLGTPHDAEVRTKALHAPPPTRRGHEVVVLGIGVHSASLFRLIAGRPSGFEQLCRRRSASSTPRRLSPATASSKPMLSTTISWRLLTIDILGVVPAALFAARRSYRRTGLSTLAEVRGRRVFPPCGRWQRRRSWISSSSASAIHRSSPKRCSWAGSPWEGNATGNRCPQRT